MLRTTCLLLFLMPSSLLTLGFSTAPKSLSRKTFYSSPEKSVTSLFVSSLLDGDEVVMTPTGACSDRDDGQGITSKRQFSMDILAGLVATALFFWIRSYN
jgi:hypothetical protein